MNKGLSKGALRCSLFFGPGLFPVQQLFEFGRGRDFYGDGLLGRRVLKRKVTSTKHQAFVQDRLLWPGILLIPDNEVPKLLHVQAELMCAACDRA